MNADILLGILRRGTAGKYKLALYTDVVQSLTYTKMNEVVGQGYVKGGKDLSDPTYGSDDKSAWLKINGKVTWKNSTLKAKSAMIYNEQTGNVLQLVDFKREVSSTSHDFDVELPDDPLITWEV